MRVVQTGTTGLCYVMVPVDDHETVGEFDAFFARHEPVLRRVLVAGFGPELGRDAAAEALAWAWSTWPKAEQLGNPGGYLYRIGANWAGRWARRSHRPSPLVAVATTETPTTEPGLAGALRSLTPRQMEVVVLIEGHGYTHAETAAFLGIKRSSVQNHLERAMAKLRDSLGVER